jgi:protein-disulfide isomerase
MQNNPLSGLISTLIALQIVTLAVVAGGGFYLFRDLQQQIAGIATGARAPSAPANVNDWQGLVRDHNAAQGKEDAEIVLIEFSDFQCPFCKRYSEETRRELAAQLGGDVRMVFKHLPLTSIHPQAMAAAIAAQCANRHGKFWEVHEQFFAQPDALSLDRLLSVGTSLGLSAEYAACVTNGETRTEVEQDMADAAKIGLQGTPSFVINGKVLVGAQSATTFRSVFDEVTELAK